MWKRAQYRRPGRDGSNASASIGAGSRGAARAESRAAVVVDEYDGLTLLRSSPDALPKPDGVAELARFLGGEKANDVFTVVVGADDATAGLWARLGTVLDSAREQGATTVRLALSGAGRPRPDRPALAQRIADAWSIEVIAPDAGVVIVPGGSLFAIGAGAPVRGWRSFTPGAEPTPLGRRSPEPHWQPALARLPAGTVGGCVVEQIPAGLLVRSARVPRARAADLCYAVPVDNDHLTVLVGAADGDPGIPAADLAAVLAALPETIRAAARLAPCGPIDLLAVGQDTAEILGADVEVLTGLPLVVGTDTEPVVRPVLIGADAEPTWVPFVEAVLCRPYGAEGADRVPAPQLARWRSPVVGTDHPEPGAIALSDRWQVSVTRAGLAVGPRGEAPAFAGRPVSPEQLAIEVNLRGEAADDVLFADLSRLLTELGSGVRGFVTLHRVVPAHASGEEDFRLLRLAIEHGVSLVEPQPVETPAAPVASIVRTVAIPRASRPQGATAESSARPAAAGPDSAARRTDEPAVPQTTGSAHRPEPAGPPSSPDAPPVRAHEAAPSGPPRERGGAEPLPPSLGRIPRTPVLGRPPEPVPSSGTAAESALPPVSPPATPATPPTPVEPAKPAEPVAPAAAASPDGAAPMDRPDAAEPPPAPLAPVGPAPAAAPAPPVRPRTKPVPGPARRSSEKERAEFRSLAQPVWERYSATVNRAMTRMPALRGPQVDAARTDLVAVHVYLSDTHGELAPPGEETPDDTGLPGCYTACLSSGLCRLPSYRGVAVRGGLPAEGGIERFVPGSVLRRPGAVSALPIGVAGGLSATAGGFVIWSSTGRRVRPLLGSVPGLAADEVVFPPGTGLRVLDVRSAGPAPIVLLSEVLGADPAADDRTGGLDEADRANLERLDEALRRQTSTSGGTSPAAWPARCATPLDG